jgi:hypothetical protein
VADHQAYPVSDGPAVEVMEHIEDPALPPQRATSGGSKKRRGTLETSLWIHRVHSITEKQCAHGGGWPDDPQGVAASAMTRAPGF